MCILTSLKHIRAVVFILLLCIFFFSFSQKILRLSPLKTWHLHITEPPSQNQNFLTLPYRFFSKSFVPSLFRSGCQQSVWLLLRLSKFKDISSLKPSTQQLQSYIQDTTDFLNKIKKFNFTSKRKNFCYLDVKAL